MTSELAPTNEPSKSEVTASSGKMLLPQIISSSSQEIVTRYIEFFFVHIRNPNTRRAYRNGITPFLNWCQAQGLSLTGVTPLAIAAYIESHQGSAPTINQHLVSIRRLFAWFEDARLIEHNPAKELRGVKHRVKVGKTPALSDEEVKLLFESFDISHVVGLRDRALIGTMFYSFARIGAVLAMQVKDYFPKGKRYWLRLHEKGGKYHEVPAHHTLEAYLDSYIELGNLADAGDTPLFRTTRGRSRRLTERRLQQQEALAMVRRRVQDAGIFSDACNHTFRASGITNFLSHGGSLDNAQRIAAHEVSSTTALYDRRGDTISLDEIERIRL